MNSQRSANVVVTLANVGEVGESLDSVRQQAGLILEWLTSDDGKRAVKGVIQRYRLQVEPGDLEHQAWLRITTSFSARSEPLSWVQNSADAAKYGQRALSNLALDQVRIDRRRVKRDDRLLSAAETSVVGPEDRVLGVMFFEEVVRRVSASRIESGNCGGCSPEVIRSIAIRVIQLIALESTVHSADDDKHLRSRDWFDHVVDSAVGRIDGEVSSERIRKRHSRCKACVRELLADVMGKMEGRND
jgi:hypothetical protein